MRVAAIAHCLASALAAAGPSQTLLAPDLDTVNSSLSLNSSQTLSLKSLDSVECPSGTGCGMKVVTTASRPLEIIFSPSSDMASSRVAHSSLELSVMRSSPVALLHISMSPNSIE